MCYCNGSRRSSKRKPAGPSPVQPTLAASVRSARRIKQWEHHPKRAVLVLRAGHLDTPAVPLRDLAHHTKDRADLGGGDQVLEVVIRPIQFVDLDLEFLVDRLQLFVGGFVFLNDRLVLLDRDPQLIPHPLQLRCALLQPVCGSGWLLCRGDGCRLTHVVEDHQNVPSGPLRLHKAPQQHSQDRARLARSRARAELQFTQQRGQRASLSRRSTAAPGERSSPCQRLIPLSAFPHALRQCSGLDTVPDPAPWTWDL